MEFYSDIKKNEILSFAGKWMELEKIIFYVKLPGFKKPKTTFSLICGIQARYKYSNIMKNRSH
jgi:hypothetical protein